MEECKHGKPTGAYCYYCFIERKTCVNAYQEGYQKGLEEGRSKMCVHKERDEIGGDCEVCAEIVKEGGTAYKRGYQTGVERIRSAREKKSGTK